MGAAHVRKDWRAVAPVWREKPPTPPPAGVAVESAPVVVVGAGPVGLALAIDLAQRGQKVVVLSRFDFVAGGSKAICFSKHSLDILDRLGVGEAAVRKGVSWNVGKVFWGGAEAPVYAFDVLPLKDQKMPGFINLQQYHLEELLLARAAELPGLELRWGHEVVDHANSPHGARVSVATAEGEYEIDTDWLVACDGSRSTIRERMGLSFEGRVFEDNFLIADIRMRDERPAERWFWFDPPFSPGQSALLHKQPDDVWRLDFQLGWNIDREACVRPENVDPLVRAMLGPDVVYEPEWYSVYTFQCRRMSRFVHGRTVFAGDSAHLVSPFGARGCNGGLADGCNLAWKLDLVLRGAADAALLESYDEEAIRTADENILNSTRSTDFLTPKSRVSRQFRDAVLELAAETPFARRFVNSGRLSTAVTYVGGSLSTTDEDDWRGAGVAPGVAAIDAPLGGGWLLERLGDGFRLLTAAAPAVEPEGAPAPSLAASRGDTLLMDRYALGEGGAYLLRPDGYVAARWRSPTREKVERAVGRAMGAG